MGQPVCVGLWLIAWSGRVSSCTVWSWVEVEETQPLDQCQLVTWSGIVVDYNYDNNDGNGGEMMIKEESA